MDVKEIKARKKALKLTTAELAWRAELPISTVSKIMTGETKNPSYLTIEKLEKVILHEEMQKRLQKYRDALDEYMRNHPGEYVDQRWFEKKYREENHLNNAPLPDAVPISDVVPGPGPVPVPGAESEGSLAKRGERLVRIETLSEIDEDRRVELLNGHLIFNDAPSIKHQRVVQNTGKIIDRYIEKNKGKCQIFFTGVGMQPEEDDYTMLIPDIAVVCNPEIIGEDHLHGAPDWVIEVTSPSTKGRDYKDKMLKYISAGVREYWIVDPDKEIVAVYAEGDLVDARIYSFDEDIPAGIYDGKLKLNFKDFKKN